MNPNMDSANRVYFQGGTAVISKKWGLVVAQGTTNFHNHMLKRSDWSSFLANLARSHREQPVAIEQDGDLLLRHQPETGVPLQGIELRAAHKGQSLVVTTAAQTYTIESPNLIWTVRNEKEDLVAVEILDVQDHTFIMRFDSGK